LLTVILADIVLVVGPLALIERNRIVVSSKRGTPAVVRVAQKI